MTTTNILSRLLSSKVVWAIVIAVMAAAAGWQGALFSKGYYLSPGQAIANTWMAQFTTLTKPTGEPKSPDEVVIAAQISLLAQTLGVALHHTQVSEDQWQYIEPRLTRTVAMMPAEAQANMQAIVNCILAARKGGSMDVECVREAAKIPFY